MKKKMRYLAMLLMSTAMVMSGCGGGANSAASQSAAEEASRLAEEEAKAAEEAAAEASRLAEEEAARKAEEEAAAAEAALEAELAEYGIERVDEGVLVDIAALCEEEKYTEACDIMRTDPAYEEAARALEASGEDRLIVQTEHGRIGLYHANGDGSVFVGDYFIYHGDYAGDRREGNGVWMEADVLGSVPEYYHIAAGEWKNDLPNGTFEIRSATSDGGEFVRTASYKDGLCDGESIFVFTDQNGDEQESITVYRDGYPETSPMGFTREELESFQYSEWTLEGNTTQWYHWHEREDGAVDLLTQEEYDREMSSFSWPNYLLGFRPFE